MKTLRNLAVLSNPQSDAPNLLAALPPADSAWPALLQSARRQRLLPAIAKNLRDKLPADAIPGDIRDALAKSSHETAAMNSLLLRDAETIAIAAADAGVPLAPIKGLHLLNRLYAVDERPMSDIDFFARKSDAPRLAPMMKDLGYQPDSGELSEDFLIRHGCELKFRRDVNESPVRVEIRWDLPQSAPLKKAFPTDPEAFWRRARRGNDGPYEFLPEDHLLICAFHLSVLHAFARLLWVSDIHRLIIAETIDWDIVAATAEAARARAAAYYPLVLSRNLYHSDVPDSLLDRLRTRTPLLSENIIAKCMKSDGHITQMGLVRALIPDRPAAFLIASLFPGLDYLASQRGASRSEALKESIARPFKFLLWNVSGKK